MVLKINDLQLIKALKTFNKKNKSMIIFLNNDILSKKGFGNYIITN